MYATDSIFFIFATISKYHILAVMTIVGGLLYDVRLWDVSLILICLMGNTRRIPGFIIAVLLFYQYLIYPIAGIEKTMGYLSNRSCDEIIPSMQYADQYGCFWDMIIGKDEFRWHNESGLNRYYPPLTGR